MTEVIFYQLLFSAVELAMFMFVITETNEMSAANITATQGALSVLLPTFIFCTLSEHMTERMRAIADAFYGCPWYRLSAQQQLVFLLPVQRSQRAFRLNGLGIVDCSLAVFVTVIL